MLIVVGSVKSSPGTTTTALALAAFRPGLPALVIEADPAGGDIKAWRQLPGEPGLTGLAAQARHTSSVTLADQHASVLPGGLRVVTAPTGGEQAAAAIGVLTGSGAGFLREAAAGQEPVVVDVGRLDPSSPALGVLGLADRVLLVLRPSLGEVTRVIDRVGALAGMLRPGAGLAAVLVGPGHPAANVERALGIQVLAQLPQDRAGAGAIAGLAPAGRGLSRRLLARAARAAWARIEQPPADTPAHVPNALASIGATP
jgi:Mrp family chromosome partitioning ATPase